MSQKVSKRLGSVGYNTKHFPFKSRWYNKLIQNQLILTSWDMTSKNHLYTNHLLGHLRCSRFQFGIYVLLLHRFIAPKLGCPPWVSTLQMATHHPLGSQRCYWDHPASVKHQGHQNDFEKKNENIKWIGEVSIWIRFFTKCIWKFSFFWILYKTIFG